MPFICPQRYVTAEKTINVIKIKILCVFFGFQALQKEVAAKEHSVTQLKTEAKELGDTEKSLTSDIDLIVKEYKALNSQAMVILIKIIIIK